MPSIEEISSISSDEIVQDTQKLNTETSLKIEQSNEPEKKSNESDKKSIEANQQSNKLLSKYSGPR
jgi:hypothetical protein